MITIAKKPNKNEKRHHASKHYKKHDKNIEDCIIDTENPDENGMRAIKEMCRMWWNGWKNPKYIKLIVDGLIEIDKKNISEKLKTIEKEEFLKPVYNLITKRANWDRKEIPRSLFTYNFILGVPFFVEWLKEEEIDKRNRIKGKLENEILNLFVNKFGLGKSLNLQTIYDNIDNFPSVIDGVLKRLENKNVIYPMYRMEKTFIGLRENLKHDKKRNEFYME